MTGPPLVGRDDELGVIADLVGGLGRGRPFVLAVRGEDGSGRSALLRAAHDAADEGAVRVLAVRGVEMDPPPYAALDTLLRPLGFGPNGGGDPAAMASAALASLAGAAADQPILLLLDDASGLDPESTRVLTTVLSQIGVEAVGAIAAVGATAGPFDAVATHSLPLAGLSRADLALVATETAPCLSAVADTVADWAGGSPLLAVELTRSLRADERDGSAPLPGAPRPTVLVVDRLQRRLDELPAGVQRALVVASADRSGSAAVVARALVELGEPTDALDTAESTGLVTVEGDQVALQPALVRPLAYRLVASASRRAAHRALADALTEPDQAMERVDQLVRSTNGPDPAVAELLDLVARVQDRRGALAGAAEAHLAAARLSADPGSRATRLLAAARAHRSAGDQVAARGAALAAEALGDETATSLLGELAGGDAPDRLTAVLSAAEIRVAEAVASGRTNRQAADALFISAKTVDFHLQSIYRKLAIRSRAELATVVATRRGPG